MNPKGLKAKTRTRCRRDSKSVKAACVQRLAVVTMELPEVLQDDIGFARDYLVVLPQRIREVEEAAEAVLRTGGRQ